MSKNILLAVPFGLLAAAPLLSLVSPVGAEVLVGFGTVLVLLGVAAMEYGITWKRLFSR